MYRYAHFLNYLTSDGTLHNDLIQFRFQFRVIGATMFLICCTILIFMRIIGIATDTTRVNINKYCRDKDRLITSEENDEYLLVTAESNATVILACRYW